jgi:hypothetical protein
MKFKLLTADEVIFRIEVEQDDIEVRGNAMCSGNEEDDAECENDIIRRLNNGDVWAWANVHVIASWPTNDFTGDTYLGCCSYESEEDFKKDAYYTDMCNDALKNLNDSLQKHFDFLMTRISVE